jgi:hypothetical protein
MCCLKYEHEVYSELSKITPRPDSLVETPDGPGTVIDSSILRGTCAVRLDGETDEIHTYKCEDCEIVRSSRKGRRSSNVATRAAAAAALSSRPKAEAPVQEFPEARSVSLSTMASEESASPSEKGADSPAKPRRNRRKRRPEGERRENAEGESHEKRSRSAHSAKSAQQPKEANAAEKKDGSKPRRRRRSYRGSRKSNTGERQNTANK